VIQFSADQCCECNGGIDTDDFALKSVLSKKPLLFRQVKRQILGVEFRNSDLDFISGVGRRVDNTNTEQSQKNLLHKTLFVLCASICRLSQASSAGLYLQPIRRGQQKNFRLSSSAGGTVERVDETAVVQLAENACINHIFDLDCRYLRVRSRKYAS